MITQENLNSFIKRYKNICPLIILRTLEASPSLGYAFDILEDFDFDKGPIIWDEENKKWLEKD
jgi:hypothetical protein